MPGQRRSGPVLCQDSCCYIDPPPNPDTLLQPVDDSQTFLEAFWCRVSQLTTRTRNDVGEWVGSKESREWNTFNTEVCSRCQRGRTWKACVLEDDQLTCLPCRDSKMGCDRKTKFIFEYTKNNFFPTMDEFMSVYAKKEQADCKIYRKWASRKLRESIPYSELSIVLIVMSRIYRP
ncbi:hypothetical protein R3P38DRAFT_2538758 [Favolaschia claudopus]|uniref:Uncharacterized protein n=1 Tax=Favolaschia claudopus TaxID=2862362 RepID=A0AAW0AZ13_9AGAR